MELQRENFDTRFYRNELVTGRFNRVMYHHLPAHEGVLGWCMDVYEGSQCNQIEGEQHKGSSSHLKCTWYVNTTLLCKSWIFSVNNKEHYPQIAFLFNVMIWYKIEKVLLARHLPFESINLNQSHLFPSHTNTHTLHIACPSSVCCFTRQHIHSKSAWYLNSGKVFISNWVFIPNFYSKSIKLTFLCPGIYSTDIPQRQHILSKVSVSSRYIN